VFSVLRFADGHLVLNGSSVSSHFTWVKNASVRPLNLIQLYKLCEDKEKLLGQPVVDCGLGELWVR
jgi:hypothetical protein